MKTNGYVQSEKSRYTPFSSYFLPVVEKFLELATSSSQTRLVCIQIKCRTPVATKKLDVGERSNKNQPKDS